LALSGIVLATACSESPTIATREPALQHRASIIPGRLPLDPDEYLAQMADRIPGFAGFYVRDGTLILRLKGLAVGPADVVALSQALRADPDAGRFHRLRVLLDKAPMQIEPSRYDARELWQFKVAALAGLFIPGVRSLDLDESRGVLRIGISNAGVTASVEARASTLGIPGDALVTEVTEPVQLMTGLRDRIRPVPAGVRIDPDDSAEVIICTVGVNALTSQGWGFVAAAHCSQQFGGVQGTDIYQEEVGYGNLIAAEIADPELWSPGSMNCPDSVDGHALAGCRASDAAFFGYIASSIPDSFTVARTLGSSGSVTIDPNHPRFLVGGASWDYPYQGMDVHKIGSTTGWTTGEVTQTCVYTYSADSILRMCSALTDLDANTGDSGAPVFTWDGSSSDIEIVGILWGGVPYSTMLYSPWLLVAFELEQELGEELQIVY